MTKKKESEEKMATTKSKALDTVLEGISKDLGHTISTVGSSKIAPVPRLTSGSVSLDLAMGGGWAKGRIHEVYGPEAGGKTMLTLFAISQAQKAGLNAAFVDMEHALDLSWASQLGVDVPNTVIEQPDSGEEALTLARKLVQSKSFGIVVVDSVSALVPQAELDGEIGDSHMGLQARLLGQALRVLSPTAAETGTIVIFINQLRMKLGVMFGNPETTSGGQALKFYSSMRLDVRKVSKSEIFNEAKQQIGHDQRIKIVKNKTAPPYREAQVPIFYGSGIRQVDDIMSAAQAILPDAGLTISGGKYKNLAALKDALTESEGLRDAARKEILTKAGLA